MKLKIGYQKYRVSEFSGNVDFNQVAPYIGVGYGNPVGENRRWHVDFDFGLMIQGQGDVTLNVVVPDPTPNPDPEEPTEFQVMLDEQIENEIDDWEDITRGFYVYPVVSLGISFRF